MATCDSKEPSPVSYVARPPPPITPNAAITDQRLCFHAKSKLGMAALAVPLYVFVSLPPLYANGANVDFDVLVWNAPWTLNEKWNPSSRKLTPAGLEYTASISVVFRAPDCAGKRHSD